MIVVITLTTWAYRELQVTSPVLRRFFLGFIFFTVYQAQCDALKAF